MTTTLRAKFDGKVLIPEGPVNLPQGKSLTVRVDSDEIRDVAEGQFDDLAKLGEQLAQHPPDSDSPGDRAAQHDHYLYGTPKRPNP